MIKSLSFFLAAPIVALACVRGVEGKKGLKTATWLLIVSFLIVGMAFIGLSARIGEAAAGDDGSTMVRYLGLLDALDLFERSPLIGFGYGVIRGLDAFSFTIASFGIVGTVALWFAIWRFLRKLRQRASPILAGAVICMIAGCIFSNNVFDHLFIWIMLAVLAACPPLSSPAVIRMRTERSPRSYVLAAGRAKPIGPQPGIVGN